MTIALSAVFFAACGTTGGLQSTKQQVNDENALVGIDISTKVAKSKQRINDNIALLEAIKNGNRVGEYNLPTHNQNLEARINSRKTQGYDYAFGMTDIPSAYSEKFVISDKKIQSTREIKAEQERLLKEAEAVAEEARLKEEKALQIAKEKEKAENSFSKKAKRAYKNAKEESKEFWAFLKGSDSYEKYLDEQEQKQERRAQKAAKVKESIAQNDFSYGKDAVLRNINFQGSLNELATRIAQTMGYDVAITPSDTRKDMFINATVDTAKASDFIDVMNKDIKEKAQIVVIDENKTLNVFYK